jgi:DNA topoisomerase-1
MDKEIPSNGHLNPGISIRMGPVEDIDVDNERRVANGVSNGKRKSRGSLQKSSKEATSSDEDDEPLVRLESTPYANFLH